MCRRRRRGGRGRGRPHHREHADLPQGNGVAVVVHPHGCGCARGLCTQPCKTRAATASWRARSAARSARRVRALPFAQHVACALCRSLSTSRVRCLSSLSLSRALAQDVACALPLLSLSRALARSGRRVLSLSLSLSLSCKRGAMGASKQIGPLRRARDGGVEGPGGRPAPGAAPGTFAAAHWLGPRPSQRACLLPPPPTTLARDRAAWQACSVPGACIMHARPSADTGVPRVPGARRGLRLRPRPPASTGLRAPADQRPWGRARVDQSGRSGCVAERSGRAAPRRA